MAKIPHDPDEILAVVNETDIPIGKSTRKEVHDKGLLHREAYIYLVNPAKKLLLLHKRADNHLWDHSSAGHFPYNQDYLEAAQRELEEELGIKLEKEDFKEIDYRMMKKELFMGRTNNRFARVFLVEKDIPLDKFNFDRGEIEEIKYFGKKDILELLNHPEQITSAAVEIIKKHILKKL